METSASWNALLRGTRTVAVLAVAIFATACSRDHQPPVELDMRSDDPRSVQTLRRLGAEFGLDNSGRVTALGLENSNFTDDELALVNGLPQLERLFLAHSQVSNDGLRHLHGLTRLQHLVLPIPVTDSGLRNLEQLQSLRELTLVDTQITDAGLEHLRPLTSLERLVLPPQITDVGLEHLKALPNLNQLDLSFTAVTDTALVELRQHSKLKKLFLFGTRITDTGLAHVEQFANLRTIDVSYTDVSDEGVSNLRRSCPELEIVRVVHEPVATNGTVTVEKGFRGDVHGMLHGKTQLEVTAQWSPIGKGRDRIEQFVPQRVYELFRDLKVANERQIYTERDFSAFLPEKETMGHVGEIWDLDLARIAHFLTQFHGRPSTRLVALGRRAGPDGGFATLRAASPKYFDVRFRIHAEFELSPVAWYTPAYLRGQLLINREAGTVEYFRLEHPAEKSLNVHLTAAVMRGQFRDIVHVDRMELTGGSSELADGMEWDEAIETAAVEGLLSRPFYRFMNIEWVPVPQALELATAEGKPIFAVVLWGALDDQSC